MNNVSKLFIGVIFFLQYACNNSDTNSKATSLEKIAVENQGVNIDYFDSKVGDTTLLFLHGWNIDKTYWENQTDFFSKKYRVIALDLPGFGKSGKNRKNWTVDEYGKDITAILTKLDLDNVILIGHSMSGAIVLEAALKNPTRVVGVVGVDNFTNFGAVLSSEVKKDISDAYKALKTNYREIAMQYVNQSLFAPSTDSFVRKRVTNDFLNVDSIIAVEILETNDKYPIDEKLKSLGKTLYLINSSYHPTDTSEFKRYSVPFKLFYVGPTGHYPMIENSNEFNKKLEQVIKEIGKSKD
jgi:pimeloyl-ACP methyl ester carboxylesterase